MDWPPITEPLLLERLAMDDATFTAFMDATLRGLGPRPFTPEVLATALGYPWQRPRTSFLLVGDEVREPDEEPATDRYPLLTFGSNGAPATLARKLAHLPGPDRRLLVQAGELEGFDVGACAHPTGYGSMAAALFASPGTAVRAAVLWVTAAQLTQLCWTEVGYRFGRLDDVVFRPDGPGEEPVRGVFAYAARTGAFCPDGEPLAMAALPATGRTAPALTQEGLLDRAAALAIGPDARAADLVRVVFEDLPALADGGGSDRIRAAGRPFASDHWTPWPGGR